MNALDALGAAAHRKLRAQRELAAANAAFGLALAQIHADGTPKCRVAGLARENLTLHGFEPDDLRRLAVSDASVRLLLERWA